MRARPGPHMRPLLVALCLFGCGGDPAGPVVSHDMAPLLAARSGDGLVVAEVGGVPIHDECVRTQAEALGIDARAALEQCIDFELLAQAAQARGLGREPEVIEVGKVEAVRRLLGSEIMAPYPSADRIEPGVLADTYRAIEPRIHAPEVRSVAHVLAYVPKDEPAGTAADKEARALAGDIHAALAGKRDLTLDEFFRIALEVAGDRRLGPRSKRKDTFKREHFKLFPSYPNIDPAFTEATFAIAEPGTVSPPVRTHVGWHVLLLTGIQPETYASPEQAREVILAHLRRERYQGFIGPLQKSAAVAVHEDALARIQAADEATRLIPSESP